MQCNVTCCNAGETGVPVTILDPDCTSKTFPDYFEKLAALSS